MSANLTRRTLAGAALASGFLAAILAANWATSTHGFMPVGFGYEATAGTFFAGLTLAIRDGVQDTLGRRFVIALIITGAALSFLLAAPMIAVASAAAFLLAELADFAIYSPLRARSRLGDKRWTTAVVASNTVGAVVDTVVFLGIAFGAAAILPALIGQLVGKGWATLAYLLVGKAVSRAVPSKPVIRVGA